MVSRVAVRGTPPTLAVLVLVLAGGSVARAESDKTEALIRQALDLRRTGDDQKAYHLFREAYQVSNPASPRTAGQLGFCEQALGSWVDAETHLAESLRAPRDPWIRKNRPAIERALMIVKSHIARVEVNGEPAAAKVLINGSVVGQLPLADAVRVAAGEIEIELRAPGFAPTRKRVRVEGGQYHKILLGAEKDAEKDAERASAARPVAPPPVVEAVPPMAAAAPVAPVAPVAPMPSGLSDPVAPVAASSGTGSVDTERSSPGAFRASLKFVSWGLAAGALGLGIYGVMRNSTLVSSFDSGCGNDAMGVARVTSPPPPGFSDARCADLKHSYESATTLSVVGFVGAGVLAGAGFVLWATEPRQTEVRTGFVSCAPALTRAGGPFAACVARF